MMETVCAKSGYRLVTRKTGYGPDVDSASMTVNVGASVIDAHRGGGSVRIRMYGRDCGMGHLELWTRNPRREWWSRMDWSWA